MVYRPKPGGLGAWLIGLAGSGLLVVAPIGGGVAAQVNDQTVFRTSGEVGDPISNSRRMRYGRKPWQSIEYFRGRGSDVPVIVQLPDGDWPGAGGSYSTSFLPDFAVGNGYAFADVGFGSLRDISAAQAAAEIALALAKLRSESATVRFNPDRILLVGGGSGGHFAALIATDLSYAAGAGVPPAAICGVVTINGDGFDIPRRVKEGNAYRAGKYRKALGDERTQSEASPSTYVGQPNAGAFLLLASADSPEAAKQADQFGAQLIGAGTPAERGRFPKWMREVRRTYIGVEENEGTKRIAAFVKARCS